MSGPVSDVGHRGARDGHPMTACHNGRPAMRVRVPDEPPELSPGAVMVLLRMLQAAPLRGEPGRDEKDERREKHHEQPSHQQ